MQLNMRFKEYGQRSIFVVFINKLSRLCTAVKTWTSSVSLRWERFIVKRIRRLERTLRYIQNNFGQLHCNKLIFSICNEHIVDTRKKTSTRNQCFHKPRYFILRTKNYFLAGSLHCHSWNQVLCFSALWE